MYNSKYALYSNMLELSVSNGSSIIESMVEDVRYLMHKYNIVQSNFSKNIHTVL